MERCHSTFADDWFDAANLKELSSSAMFAVAATDGFTSATRMQPPSPFGAVL